MHNCYIISEAIFTTIAKASIVTPIQYYQKLIESDQILRDPQQMSVIENLQTIYEHLLDLNKQNHFLQLLTSKKSLTRGLYLWGEVGIGKTFLVDCFFYCLPFKNKMRTHFHRFMKMIHEQLSLLQGKANPLEKIAKNLASETCVICFDELVISDITDAMLLAGLFEALYKEKICLLFTSNSAPDDLYKKGLQRDRFLPAIELIKENSDVIHITTTEDYRLRNYEENKFYYTPLTSQSEKKLEDQFKQLSHEAIISTEPLLLYERKIPVKQSADGVVWFEFETICNIPRNQNDYILIAKQFHTIMISNVTVIQTHQNDVARLFINLVDVLYDANKKLIISAEKPIEQIYLSGRMFFEFSRTKSRLIEMQTLSWQQKCEALQK